MLPDDAEKFLVFAHGAGAGMTHRWMEAMAQELAGRRIGTLRYQFPYMEQGSRRPDPKPLLFATVRAAVRTAGKLSEGLPLYAGGKSMGGRMTSMAAAESPLPDVRGIVFFGFPLHPPGAPSTTRAEHLSAVSVPMLFLQGTRDTLADLDLLKPVCRNLGTKSTLEIVEGADHSFHVLKKSGMNDAAVMATIGSTVRAWMT